MTDLTMSQFASKDDLIAAQAARIAELEREVDAERRHHGKRNASAVRTLHALGYSWRGADEWHPAAPLAAAHPDDAAVDALAALMKAKLAEKRAKGYGGWNDKTQCPQQRLSDMLRAHVDKGDPVDVANFCAMLSARGEGIAAAALAVQVTADLGRAALEKYLKECDENQIVPDVGGAFAYAWQRAAAPQAVQAAVPSDADIDAAIQAFDWDGWIDQGNAKRAFTHEALARWAAPPHPAEAVPAQGMDAK